MPFLGFTGLGFRVHGFRFRVWDSQETFPCKANQNKAAFVVIWLWLLDYQCAVLQERARGWRIERRGWLRSTSRVMGHGDFAGRLLRGILGPIMWVINQLSQPPDPPGRRSRATALLIFWMEAG